MKRFLTALRAFLRPGLSRGWPGAFVLESPSGTRFGVTVAAGRSVFFDDNMQMFDASGAEGPQRVVMRARDFDRRKGRREAFADAWRSR